MVNDWKFRNSKHSERAPLKSEEKYRVLFDSTDQAICVIELIEACGGNPADFRYIEVNEAHGRLSGLGDVTGKLGSEVVPGAEAYWHETYGAIVRTGEPKRFENYNQDTRRWYNVFASRIGELGSRLVCVISQDTTERKERENRQAFLLKLSDDYRENSSEGVIGRTCVDSLARQMSVDRCYITEMSDELNLGLVGPEYHSPGLRPVSGEHSYDAYPDGVGRFKAGKAHVISDLAADSTLSEKDKTSIGDGLQLQSMINAFLYRGTGHSIWALSVGSVGPRAWNSEEVRLVEETAERTWASIERARIEAAARKSEAWLAREVEDAKVLQTISNQLVSGPALNGEYRHIVEAARLLMRSDAASIQELDDAGSRLKLLAHVGFDPRSAEFWEWVDAGVGSSCGRALGTGQRVVVPDMDTFEAETSEVEAYRQSGLLSVQSTPLIARSGQVIGMMSTHWKHRHTPNDGDYRFFDILARLAADFIERRRSDLVLQESEERFQQFANASSNVLWMRNATTLEMEYASSAFESLYGVAPGEGMDGVEHWAALIVPEDREMALAGLENAKAGRGTVTEFRIRRKSDGAFRWVRNTTFPLRDGNGVVRRIGGLFADTTEARISAEHQTILVAELQHRVRNIMAMIRSVTAQTGETAKSPKDYAKLIDGRLMALARTQALLTRGANAGVEIRQIVEDELRAQAQQQVQYEISGPDLVIAPKAAEILSLAIHELATNALKHGALAVADGKVSVSWRFTGEDHSRLQVHWSESRPKRAGWAAPTRRGFGIELVEERVPYELRGKGSIRFRPDGVDAVIEFPLLQRASILETDAPARTSVFGGSIDMTGETSLAGQTVLVLEDDFYLARDAASALRGAGADICGPFPNEVGAISAVEAQMPTLAVIDINLGDGPSFETARALRKARKPFLFLTGYNEEAIPAEFSDIIRLQKPIELKQVVRALAALVEQHRPN